MNSNGVTSLTEEKKDSKNGHVPGTVGKKKKEKNLQAGALLPEVWFQGLNFGSQIRKFE